jgi:hypothetical protein
LGLRDRGVPVINWFGRALRGDAIDLGEFSLAVERYERPVLKDQVSSRNGNDSSYYMVASECENYIEGAVFYRRGVKESLISEIAQLMNCFLCDLVASDFK